MRSRRASSEARAASTSERTRASVVGGAATSLHVLIDGVGFSAIGRLELLKILQKCALAEGVYWRPDIETMPWSEVERMQLAKLRTQLDYVFANLHRMWSR